MFKRFIYFYSVVLITNFFAAAQEPPPSPFGQSPTLSGGNWNYTVIGTEITEAGLDFEGIYESYTNQLIFNRNSTSVFYPNWSVTVNKSDVFWNANMKVWIRRTGDGTGVGGSSITGGNNYIEIVNTPVSFFSGYKERDEVPLQYKLTGVSVIVPVDSYSTVITLTITDS